MYFETDAPWRKLLQTRLGEYKIEDLIKTNKSLEYTRNLNIPIFYKEVINGFHQLCAAPVTNAKLARLQYLWHNDEIRVSNAPIIIKSMYRQGIITIEDILLPDSGRFMNIRQLKAKYPAIRTNFVAFQGLINAIPRAWKELLRLDPLTRITTEERESIVFHTREETDISLAALKSKHCYLKLLAERRPTAENRWITEGYVINSWQSVYEIPYKCSVSTRLQALHYRIVNRYIPTRKFLCTKNIIGSPLCRKCFEPDNLRHFFYECSDVNFLWNRILNQLKDTFYLHNGFVCPQTVLLGSPGSPSIVNLVILLLKQHIVRCKLGFTDRTSELRLETVKVVINNFYQAERLVAVRKEKVDDVDRKWHRILDDNKNLLIC